jgi:hypothetical protein
LLRVSAEGTSHKLFYNPASETLILERRNSVGPHSLPTRLFVRHKGAADYEQVGDPGPRMSYESPVTCEKRPIVLFNSKEWDQAGRPDWAGVYAFNLKTKELSVCIPKGSLAFQEPHVRSWILELVFLSDDGQKLYANVAIEREIPGGCDVHYYLAALDLAGKKLELLSPLKVFASENTSDRRSCSKREGHRRHSMTPTTGPILSC